MNYQINKNILRATSYSCVVYTLLKGTQLWVWGDVWGLKFRRPFLWRVMGFSLFLFFYFIFLLLYNCFMSFPSGWTVKNLPANKGDAGSVFGLRRSPGEGNGKPLQYSCLGSPMDRGAWRAIVHGVAELDRIYKFVLFFCCTARSISYLYTNLSSFFELPSHLCHHRVLGKVPWAIY